MPEHTQRRITVVEDEFIPPLDVVLAFGPMLPFVFGALVACCFSGSWSLIALRVTGLWGSAILLFLAGVRRGLSFRTEGGPTWMQLATMLALYVLGAGAVAALWINGIIWCFVLLFVGYTMIFVLDPIAAQRGEAPLYFGRLRRLQMPIALLSLIFLLIVAVRMP